MSKNNAYEREKKEQNTEKLEKSNIKKFKLIDGLIAYVISIALFACAYGFFKDIIGVWAIYIACALSLASIILLIKLTGLKLGSVLRFSSPRKLETVGCALALASVIVISLPLILISHLIAPGLALTSFNVYSVSDSTFSVIVLTVFVAICENILFDGYIYSRFKVIGNLALRTIIIALMASVMKLDMYALPCVLVSSAACLLLRNFTNSLSLPLILRICTSSFVTAMSAASAGASELIGEAMGVVQVCGMSIIFVGIACPCIVGTLGAFGKLGNKGKTFGVASGVSAIILIALGSGISSL